MTEKPTVSTKWRPTGDVAEYAYFLKAAIAAVDAAAEVIRPLFRTHLTAHAKHDESPVTIADRGAERAIRAVLTGYFPTHGLIGEEYGYEREQARYRWIIDPIDGTRAFITGRPMFGTLVALLDGERPILGVIDQPISGERWIGIDGQPTRFSGPYGGNPGTRTCATLDVAELSCTAPDMIPAESGWGKLADSVRRISWGGDCYAYGLLALGQIDIVAEANLKPWDWAAILPVVEGAGGSVTDWEGRPLRFDGDGRVLAVGDARLLPSVVARLASGA